MKVSKERKKGEGKRGERNPPKLGVKMTHSAAWDMNS